MLKVRRTGVRLFAAGALLTALAACGGAHSRSAEGRATETSAGVVRDGGQAPDAGTKPAAGEKRFKGLIVTLTDSTLVHGGSDTLRFGHLGSGEIAVLRFRIENASDKPLVLVSTQRSCGCISLDHDNQPLAPGQQQTLEMTFDSRGEYGWQLKRMDLLFAGARKPLRLFVEADVE